MIATIIIIFLISAIVAALVSIRNLLTYSERLEDILEEYQSKLTEVRDKIVQTEIRLKEIDIRGSFEADDEVGFVFKSIKEVSEDLTKTIQNLYDERNEN